MGGRHRKPRQRVPSAFNTAAVLRYDRRPAVVGPRQAPSKGTEASHRRSVQLGCAARCRIWTEGGKAGNRLRHPGRHAPEAHLCSGYKPMAAGRLLKAIDVNDRQGFAHGGREAALCDLRASHGVCICLGMAVESAHRMDTEQDPGQPSPAVG